MASNPSPARRRIYHAAMHLFAERGVTQTTVKELAEYAGVARGTIYNNVGSFENLFQEVAANLAEEMNDVIMNRNSNLNDPAVRLATGIRQYVRRSQTEPTWGVFISQFGFTHPTLKVLWSGQPTNDLLDGVAQGRYSLTQEQIPFALAQIGASVISAVMLVRDGIKTWREAGSIAAELTLRAFGLPKDEAHCIANQDID